LESELSSEAAADADALEHDKDLHGGERTAVRVSESGQVVA